MSYKSIHIRELGKGSKAPKGATIMKVIIAHPVAPGSQRMGGAVRYILYLLRYLSKKGIDTTLLGVRYTEKEFAKPDYTFVPILKGPTNRLEKGLWYKYPIRLVYKIPSLEIPDSAIIQTGRLDTMLPFVFLYPKNPKVMISDEPLAGWAKFKLGRFFPLFAVFYHILEARCLRHIDFLLTDERTKDYFLKRYPWILNKLRIVSHSAVDLSIFRPTSKAASRNAFGFDLQDRVIVFVGRLSPQKNLEFLLRVFAIVKDDLPQAKLLIVGRGEEEAKLKRYVQVLGVKDVVFTGEIPFGRIPQVINCADVLALASVTEGSPTVVKEALACGVPVVSTDVGDVRAIITNELIGRIVPADEYTFAQTLTETMEMAAEKPDEVREACVAAAKPYSVEAFGQQMIKLYKEALMCRGISGNAGEALYSEMKA